MLRAEVLETMLDGCVTRGPRACHYDTAPSPPQLPGSLHRLAGEQSHPISYLDTLIKTGSENIQAILRRRRIVFAGFVARMKDTRLPKCVMFGEFVRGAGCVGGQEKAWMGCFLDELRAFGINADQWKTAVQDEGEWRKTVEQGAERFHSEMDRCRESQGSTTYAVVCPNVTGKTKERIAQSKRARAGSLTKVD